jgi:hypothetical protein
LDNLFFGELKTLCGTLKHLHTSFISFHNKQLLAFYLSFVSESFPNEYFQIVSVIAHTLVESDVNRCTTLRKGIINDVIRAAAAFGFDTQIIAEAIHNYSCISSKYKGLTPYKVDSDGYLRGTISLSLELKGEINPILF